MRRHVKVRDQQIISVGNYSDYTCKWSLYSGLTATVSGRDSHPSGGYLKYVYAHLTTGSSSGDVTLSVRHGSVDEDGVDVDTPVELDTITIPEGANFGDVEFLEGIEVKAVRDFIEIEIVDTGSSAATITIIGVFA